MDGKVVGLKGPLQGHPATSVVELLEELLTEAKQGKFVTFGAVTVTHGGVVGTAFATSGAAHAHHLVAGALYLLRRVELSAGID